MTKEITAALVKELREKSGAGMMDCKKALVEVGGDVEEAIDWLRKKGLSAAAKKSGRVAAEGLVAVQSNKTSGVIVEVNAETDFVARNEQFQHAVSTIADIALSKKHTVESLKDATYPGEGGTISAHLTHLIAVIGENMSLRRVKILEVEHGVVASYMHSAVVPNLGKIGVLVAMESKADTAMLNDLGKKIAMHIAATQPQSLDISSIDPVAVERERAIFIDQAKASGRPDDIIQKMVDGRIRKFYEDVVLLEQAFIMDTSKRVKEVLEEASKAAGTPVTIKNFVRFTLGEGIEKEVSDFAAEVMAQARS